jgi:uncharacterized ion transporter superfamily protein YfcC
LKVGITAKLFKVGHCYTITATLFKVGLCYTFECHAQHVSRCNEAQGVASNYSKNKSKTDGNEGGQTGSKSEKQLLKLLNLQVLVFIFGLTSLQPLWTFCSAWSPDCPHALSKVSVILSMAGYLFLAGLLSCGFL